MERENVNKYLSLYDNNYILYNSIRTYFGKEKGKKQHDFTGCYGWNKFKQSRIIDDNIIV